MEMVMDLILLGAGLILVLSSIYGPPFWRAARVYLHLRKRKERTCPETGRTALVRVNALHAARTLLTRGVTDLQVSDCARWPSRRGCGQSCLSMLSVTGAREPREENSARRLHRQGA